LALLAGLYDITRCAYFMLVLSINTAAELYDTIPDAEGCAHWCMAWSPITPLERQLLPL
jgi:hypothetical protein